MSATSAHHPDRVATLIENKTILISGATGFVGKVLLEKTLRCCPQVRKIFVLVRTKKGKGPEQRLRETLKDPLFDLLKKQHGLDILKKIEAISADTAKPDLDLSPFDRLRICEEVQIVYHCAAIVRFDVTLKDAVLTNVRGTKLMLEMAKNCPKLLVFVHVSTAFCHLDEKILYERTYPPPKNPHEIIKLCESVDSGIVEKIKYEILENFPNCYPFTKALGEGLVNEQMDNLPVIIFRPSVVLPTWREPLPGYTDNINGPTGLLIAAGKGVIRTLYCKGENYLDYIPADLVANALLFTTYDYITNGKRRVYNAVSSNEYKITFNEIIKYGRTIVEEMLPFNTILWYPGGSLTQSKIKHYLMFFMFQLLPALILDGILILLRQKPFLIKVQKRALNAYKLCEYYVNRTWDFDNSVSMEAIKNLNPKEREIYKMDGRGGILRDYLYDCIHGGRLYLLKETDDLIPAAKRQMKIMWLVDLMCKIFATAIVFYYVVYYISVFFNISF